MDQDVVKEYLQAKMLKAAAEDIYEEAEEKILDELTETPQKSGDNDNGND